MTEFLYIGPVPAEEDCEQVGEDCNYNKMCGECRVYGEQLARLFPEQVKTGIWFKTKAEQHDFGRYYELVVCYDPNDPAQVTAAFHVEANLPSTWDDKARQDLAKVKVR